MLFGESRFTHRNLHCFSLSRDTREVPANAKNSGHVEIVAAYRLNNSRIIGF